jgi:hypothetical protein
LAVGRYDSGKAQTGKGGEEETMSYEACPDCGCRVYDGLCVNCDEENFIVDQYLANGDSPPDVLDGTARQQRERRDERRHILM